MKHDLSYKECTVKDLDELYKIEEQMKSCSIYYTASDKKEFESFMKEGPHFLLLRNNQLVGYCSYKIVNENLAEITGMAILDKFRGQGIGTFALEMMLEKLKNFKTVELFTHPENNNSLRLYLKHEFKIKEWRDNHFGNQPRLLLQKGN
jgi:ribosomal protein S18 acetylase RimI-like enzyme